MVKLDSENQEIFAVNMDHTKMSTFPTRSDPLFLKIVEVIKELLTRAGPKRSKSGSIFSLKERAASLEASESYSGSGSSPNCVVELPVSYSLLAPTIYTPVTEALPVAFKISQESFTAKLPCRVVRPHQRNPNYVGRAELGLNLQKSLAPRSEAIKGQRSFALCGLGGVGKTQAALGYVFDHMEDFEVVLWAHADTRGKLLEDFGGFAVELGLTKQGDSDHTGRDLLKKWFENASTKISVFILSEILLTRYSRALALDL